MLLHMLTNHVPHSGRSLSRQISHVNLYKSDVSQSLRGNSMLHARYRILRKNDTVYIISWRYVLYPCYSTYSTQRWRIIRSISLIWEAYPRDIKRQIMACHWSALEVIQDHGKCHHSIDHTRVAISMPLYVCNIFEFLDVEKYRDLEI